MARGRGLIADDFRNGHFVIDVGTELPEATEVELQLIKVADAFADMSTEGCEESRGSHRGRLRDFENGDHIGARR